VSRVRRVGDGPLICAGMLPAAEGENINGPSLIRAPSWITSPPGRYLLYFAHHRGGYIRLALADRVEGPWRIHPGGTLTLAQVVGVHDHIASPDVLVDDQRRELRMYFHAPVPGRPGQRSFLARSTDGLHWTTSPVDLGPFYFRVFRHAGNWFAFSKGGDLWCSNDGIGRFSLIGNPFGADPCHRPGFNHPGDIRHLAIDMGDGEIQVYFTRIGDAPERILRCRIVLGPDPSAWIAQPIEEVLRPELPWEGADLPITVSLAGASAGREHAVRDPAILRDDGRCWLMYSIAGESGLALAEILSD